MSNAYDILSEGVTELANQFPTVAFLPDGINSVTGVFSEQTNELSMLDAGFGTKRSGAFLVQVSQFVSANLAPLDVNQVFTIDGKPWRVDGAPRDGGEIEYRLVQAW